MDREYNKYIMHVLKLPEESGHDLPGGHHNDVSITFQQKIISYMLYKPY